MTDDELFNKFMEANFPNSYNYEREFLKKYLYGYKPLAIIPSRTLTPDRVQNNSMYESKIYPNTAY